MRTLETLTQKGLVSAAVFASQPLADPWLIAQSDPSVEPVLEAWQATYEELIFFSSALASLHPDVNIPPKQQWPPSAIFLMRKLGYSIRGTMLLVPDDPSHITEAFDSMTKRLQPHDYALETLTTPRGGRDVALGYVTLAAPGVKLN